jgi:hypothetical protein
VTANILSAARLPATLFKFLRNSKAQPALSFAPQPCDWFAFSRMMTLQALCTRTDGSPNVGRAFAPDGKTSVVRPESPTYETVTSKFTRLASLRTVAKGPAFITPCLSTANLCQLCLKSNAELESKRKYSAHAANSMAWPKLPLRSAVQSPKPVRPEGANYSSAEIKSKVAANSKPSGASKSSSTLAKRSADGVDLPPGKLSSMCWGPEL